MCVFFFHFSRRLFCFHAPSYVLAPHPRLYRAKSVRRAGSPTAEAGLEALRAPQGPPGSGAPALSGLPDMTKPFTVLGIETSCDDTAAAVVRSDGTVLGEVCIDLVGMHVGRWEKGGGGGGGGGGFWGEKKVDLTLLGPPSRFGDISL